MDFLGRIGVDISLGHIKNTSYNPHLPLSNSFLGYSENLDFPTGYLTSTKSNPAILAGYKEVASALNIY